MDQMFKSVGQPFVFIALAITTVLNAPEILSCLDFIGRSFLLQIWPVRTTFLHALRMLSACTLAVFLSVCSVFSKTMLFLVCFGL